MPRPTKARSRAQRPTVAWPWWKLGFTSSGTQVDGSVQARLSPHLLNLRAELTQPAPPRTPPRSSPSANTVSVNFARARVSWSSFVPPTLQSLFKRWPNFARLSIITCLDVAWFGVGIIFTAVSYTYLQLARELGAIGTAARADAKAYFGFIHAVARFPSVRLQVAPAAVTRTDTVRGYGFQAAAWFALVAMLVILPLKGIATLSEVSARQDAVVEDATDAVRHLQVGSNQLADGQPALAEASFSAASQRFGDAVNRLGGFSDRLLGFMAAVPGTPAKVSSASRLLAASREVSAVVAAATSAWQRTTEGEQAQRFAILEATAVELQPRLRSALEQLRGVDPASLPPDLAHQLTSLLGELDSIESLLASAFDLPRLLGELGGREQPKRYLVLFQNSSELRPTGGFAGSLAFVELRGGHVVGLDVPGGGPYDFQGGLKRTIAPPEPIRISRGTWQLQDAAWFFDFPTSARKVLWFLHESGGPAVDGVMAITVDVAADLLKLTGPIELPQYRKVLTNENFVRETQEAVELEFDPVRNRPKQFITDLAPQLLERVLTLSGAQRLELVALLERSLRQRSIQLYLANPELEATVRSFGWAGEVKSTPLDYLAIVRTNIGGGKTDAVTDEELQHEVEVLSSGELIARLSFTRYHHGDPKDVFEWRRNQDYVRFYVPQGASLISASGFTAPPPEHFHAVPAQAELDPDLATVEQEAVIDAASGVRVTQEFGKTVFAHWLNVMPGERRTVRLSYRLPFTLVPGGGLQDLRRYAMYIQRQAGVKPFELRTTLKLPPNWRVRWQESDTPLMVDQGSATLTANGMEDLSYGVILERREVGE